MKSGVSSGENHASKYAPKYTSWFAEKNTPRQRTAAVQLDTPDNCHRGVSFVKRSVVPAAVTELIQDDDDDDHALAENYCDSIRPAAVTVNGWSQGDVSDPLMQSRRNVGPPGDSGPFQTGLSGCDDEVSMTPCRLNGDASHRINPVVDVVSGIYLRSKGLRRSDDPHINSVDPQTAVHQLKHCLAERDAELRILRETMERNEMAMLGVIDEGRRAWESELVKCQSVWQRSVQDHHDRCERSKYLLESEVARLERENAAIRINKERELEVELKTTQTSENLQRPDLVLKQAKISELSSMTDKWTPVNHSACSVDTGSHLHTMTSSGNATTRTAVTQPHVHGQNISTDNHNINKVATTNCDNQELACDDVCSAKEVTQLRQEIVSITNALDSARREFDDERRRWTMEKELVIAYQKRLQLRYVEMTRRNVELEREKHRLISKLTAAVQSCNSIVGSPGRPVINILNNTGDSDC